jgi:hypothetical protein
MRLQVLYRVDQKFGGLICWLAGFLAHQPKRMPAPSEWQAALLSPNTWVWVASF